MYCKQCGKEIPEDSNFCSGCGYSIQSNSVQEDLLAKLSTRIKTSAIIWIAIGCAQILLGFWYNWLVVVVGVLNIAMAVKDINTGKRIITNPKGIVKGYEPLFHAILTLLYNLFIGGIIGVFGSVYYLIYVRGFVMENKSRFLELESTYTKNVEPPQQETPHNAEQMQMNVVVLTKQEAENGCCKEVFVEGTKIQLQIPKNTQDGARFCLRNFKVPNNEGGYTKKDIYLIVAIQD